MIGFGAGELLSAAEPTLIVAALALALLSSGSSDAKSLRVIGAALSLALLFRYVWWRCTTTLPPPGFTADFSVGAAFLFVEMASAAGAVTSSILLARTSDRSAEADANVGWLVRSGFPRVDALIPTYNEDQTILERTIVGALAIDYPNLRVFVLDDGSRPWLRALSERLGCGYIVREKHTHAKAGNINHALGVLAKLEDPAPFVTVLDADFVALPQFLKRAMPLFHDEQVAVVQTPQHFINPDPVQINLQAEKILPDEQRYFFDVVMPSRDAWGAAFCCGTSAVIRVGPLTEIGGFPTDSVTEDYLLSLRLKERGFRTVYLREPLSFGLAPEGLAEYISQRARWCLGFMQIARGRSGPLSLTSNLGLVDRIALIDSFLGWVATYSMRIAAIVVPTLCLFLNIQPVVTTVHDFAIFFGPYYVWQILFGNWLSRGRSLPIYGEVWQLLVAPDVLRAVYVGLAKPRGQKFVVTAKGGDRSRGFVHWRLFILYFGMLFLTFASIGWNFYWHGRHRPLEYGALAFFWSWYNVFVLIALGLVAIEHPRRRAAERFEADEEAIVRRGEDSARCRLLDISLTGARLSGALDLRAGDTVVVAMRGGEAAAEVVRADRDSFAVAFSQDFDARVAMTRRFYAGRYLRDFSRLSFAKAGLVLARRVLR